MTNTELAALERAAIDATAYTSDSREAAPGFVFVALKGESRDGHEYVAGAVKAGAMAVVSKAWAAGAGVDRAKLIEVEDTTKAHRELARLFRRKFKGRVLAVGGSSGKTSTKEFLAQLLAERFKLVKTDKSQNGELGIPKTLEKLRPGVELAVVEVGIDAPGDMARHAELVSPDYAVLTSIGEEHLNLLKSVENVYREEKILFDVTIARGGVCFAPGSDPWLRRLSGVKGVMLTPAEPALSSLEAARRLRERLPNAYAVQNATLALAVARELGLKESEMLAGLDRLELPEGRGNLLRLDSGTVLIADHYNSNPSSLRAGLESAASRARIEKSPLRLVLADMLDLGESTREAHDSVVGAGREARAESLWLVGPEMSRLESKLKDAAREVRTFRDSQEAAAAWRPAGRCVLVLKGSRGMKLEKVLDVVRKA